MKKYNNEIMNKIILAISIILFFTNCQSNVTQNEAQYNKDFDFYGTLDSMVFEKFSFYAKDSIWMSKYDMTESYIVRFNPLGYVNLKEGLFNKKLINEYKYDENWRLIREDMFNENSTPSTPSTPSTASSERYEYFENGNIKSNRSILFGKKFSNTFYEYDSKNSIIKTVSHLNKDFFGGNNLIDTRVFEIERDKQGRKIEEKAFILDNSSKNRNEKKFVHRIIYNYDEDGDLIYEAWYNNDGKMDYEKEVSKNGEIKKITYHEVSYVRPKAEISSEFEYPQEITFKSEVDSMGNWTSKILSINGETHKILKRKLFYRKEK